MICPKISKAYFIGQPSPVIPKDEYKFDGKTVHVVLYSLHVPGTIFEVILRYFHGPVVSSSHFYFSVCK